MPSGPDVLAGTSSTIARLAAFIFLRWIPGHLWVPIILTALAIYLTVVFSQSSAFGSNKPTLHEAFPKRYPQEDGNDKPEEQESNHVEHEEPAVYPDEKTLLKTLLLGIPNWREPRFSYISIGTNILLALFTLDLVFRGPVLHPENNLSFTRVGYVDSTSAKVLIREPEQAHFPIYVYLSPADKTNWKTTDTIYYMGPDTDYTHALTFDGLEPAKKYIYSLSNDKSGTFTTAPSPYSEAANSLTFLTSSCIKANFPYRATAHSLAIHGFEYLSKVVRSLPSPASFMLFLGDFIYVDVPIRLSSSLAHYRAEYRRVYASPSWSLPGLNDLPWIHILDDHEIANDWSSGNDTDPFPAASDPFIHYHVAVNPPIPQGSPRGPEDNTTYFQFSNGPASFFMLDTRRYRTDPESKPPRGSSSAISQKPVYGSSSSFPSANPPPTPETHSMLGQAQLSSLLAYLSTPEPSHINFKIVASSVPFTKNWRFGTSDTWGGFLRERAIILQAMHDAERELGIRVIILSGDRHEFAAIRYPPPIIASTSPEPLVAEASSSDTTSPSDVPIIQPATSPSLGPHEFSCGPLSMFYLPIRTFKQIDDEDVALTYLPDGNSKVGVVQIKNLKPKDPAYARGARSVLKYTLYVDGLEKWTYDVVSPAPATAGKGRARGDKGWSWIGNGLKGRSLWD